MFPDRQEAERLLKEAEAMNPGPWGNHSRVVAYSAERIASLSGLDADKAYVLGLLHDIGRRYGRSHLKHVSDGYNFMMSLGYDAVAKVCLTHSFDEHPEVERFIGNADIADDEKAKLDKALKGVQIDDYDRLIQLCDAIAGADRIVDVVERMSDVKVRYGSYDQQKWDTNLALKAYFEQKMGRDLYEALEKDSFVLN